MTTSYRIRKNVAKTFQYTFCVVVTLIVLVPLYMAVFGGFKSLGQMMIDPLGWPSPMQGFQYLDLLTSKVGTFWASLVNSILVAAGTVLGTLVVASLAAFALARLRFRGSGVVLSYFMLGLLFPLAVAILPLYLQVKNFGLLDSYWGVIIPQIAFQIPMNVLLLRNFFLSIPKELEDACAIDGYGPIRFLWYMVIPLSTPIMATVAVLVLVGSWNNFFLPLLVFNKETLYTLPMGVMVFQGQYNTSWNLILGYLALAMVPAVILFIAAQRYIVAGLTGSAVKG